MRGLPSSDSLHLPAFFVKFINETANLSKVLIDDVLVKFDSVHLLLQVLYDSHQDVRVGVAIVKTTDTGHCLLEREACCTVSPDGLNHFFLIIFLLQLYISILICSRQNIYCVSLQSLFVMQS